MCRMRKITTLFCFVLLMPQFVLTTSCRDDYFMTEEIGKGDAVISVSLCFDQENALLGKTRAGEVQKETGGDDGDAIQNINSLCMLFYNEAGELVHNYIVRNNDVTPDPDVADWNYKLEDNRIDEDKNEDGSQFEDDKTGSATFKLRSIKRGRYYVYAVANMGDLGDHSDAIKTRAGLKSISLTWEDEIAKNSEMFGIFSLKPDRNASDDQPVTINSPSVQLHSWLRRAASKVTVAFDGTGLYENVQIYIENIVIKDIPKTCALGNPNTPGQADVSKVYPLSDYMAEETKWDDRMLERSVRYSASNGLLEEGKSIIIQELPDKDLQTLTPENYKHVCKTQHPYLGMGEDGDDSNIITNRHAHTAKSLFFYENMQGKGKLKYQSNDGGHSIWKPNPDENEPGSGWKDEKPYGTYVEVSGYYRCTALDEHLGAGPIKFRFMLGKDVKTDYNAERNTHYKLTLKFKGYGNDADWHIEYKEPPGIHVTTPQYISYLYNKDMMTTVKVVGEMKEGYKLVAKILAKNTKSYGADRPSSGEDDEVDPDFTGWKPWGNGTTAFPWVTNGFYYTGEIYNDGPWNSFLSLRKTSVVKVENPEWEDKASWQIDAADASYYNYKYYKGMIDGKNRGKREYAWIENGSGGDDIDGKYTIVNKGSEHIFTIPLYTRAKELVTKTGFTGNNPYVAYPRKEKIKFTIEDDKGNQVGEPVYLDMIQVRRIENPKGVWRSAGKKDDFHVTLMRLPKEDETSYVTFKSEGAWRAEIMEGGDDFISLEATSEGSEGIVNTDSKRIEGASEHLIDFKIKFNGTIKETEVRCAIVRVRYHNYTCEHSIFVRQGYAPITLNGNTESETNPAWTSFNVYRFDANDTPVYTNSPLEEGSLFRRGNYTAILASNNERAGFKFGEGPDGNFTVLEKGKTAESELSWEGLQPSLTNNSLVSGWSIAGNNERIAKIEDFYTLESTSIHSNINKGYGVLYGDGATETQSSVDIAWGYDRGEDPKSSVKGMRGCFVYNINNGRNIFLPVGKSGYGRRIGSPDTKSNPNDKAGRLRYAGRSDYYTKNDPSGNIKYLPLFYDLFERPGAIYHCRNRLLKSEIKNVNESSAFDINYFTMGFEGFLNGAADADDGSNCDACFIRTVKY